MTDNTHTELLAGFAAEVKKADEAFEAAKLALKEARKARREEIKFYNKIADRFSLPNWEAEAKPEEPTEEPKRRAQ